MSSILMDYFIQTIYILSLFIITRSNEYTSNTLIPYHLHINEYVLSNKAQWNTHSNTTSCAIDIPSLCIIQSPSTLTLYYNHTLYNFFNDTQWSYSNEISIIPQDPYPTHRRLGWGRRRRSRRRKRRKKRRRSRRNRRKRKRQQRRRKRMRRRKKRRHKRRHRGRRSSRYRTGSRGPRGRRGRKGRRGRRGKRGRRGRRGRSNIKLFKALFRGIRRGVKGRRCRRKSCRRRRCMNTKCGAMGMGNTMGMNPMAMGMNPMGGMGHMGMGMNPMGGMGGMSGMGMNHMGMGGMSGMGGMHGMNGMNSMGGMNGMSGLNAMGGMNGGINVNGKEMSDPTIVFHDKTGEKGHKSHEKKVKKSKGDKSKEIHGETKKVHGKKATKSEKKHRRLGDDDVIGGYRIEKCVQVNVWLCLVYDYNGMISVKYMDIDDDKVFGGKGEFVTHEWMMNGLNVMNEQIYECHDELLKYNEVCVEKWKINENELMVLVKDRNVMEDMEFSVMDKTNWNGIYYVNDDAKRLCRYDKNMKHQLCIEIVMDGQRNEVKQINKVSVTRKVGPNLL